MNVNELEYNTQMKKLELPEYGRHIQRMVDYALEIEDPEERKRCAHTIVRIMGNLFPHLRDVSDFKHKLWDHLAIMSAFKLDIEYPYEIIQKEDLHSRPDQVPYGSKTIKIRHYGHITEELIDKVLEMEEGPEKERLIQLLANHMKKSFLTMNRELVEDKKIFDDLRLMSDGKIDIKEEELRLVEPREVTYVKKKGNNSGQRRK